MLPCAADFFGWRFGRVFFICPLPGLCAFAVRDLISGWICDLGSLQLLQKIRQLAGAAFGKYDIAIFNETQILPVFGKPDGELSVSNLFDKFSIHVEPSVSIDVDTHGSKSIDRW